jgi:NADH-quinone oxidoreductase subunit J
MGAILVLFLYTLMLINLNKDSEPRKSNLVKIAGFIGGACFLITIIAALKAFKVSQPVMLNNPDLGLVKNLGKILFNEYLLPFEVSSILLLSAMVGAVLLATKDPKTT